MELNKLEKQVKRRKEVKMTRKSRLEMHKYTIIAGGIKSSDNSAVWTYKST